MIMTIIALALITAWILLLGYKTQCEFDILIEGFNDNKKLSLELRNDIALLQGVSWKSDVLLATQIGKLANANGLTFSGDGEDSEYITYAEQKKRVAKATKEDNIRQRKQVKKTNK